MLVMIKVKSRLAEDSTLTQLLAYMSSLKEKEKNRGNKGNNTGRKLYKKTGASSKNPARRKACQDKPGNHGGEDRRSALGGS